MYRRTGLNQVSISSSGADQVLLSENPRRCAVILSPPIASRYTAVFGGTAVDGQGLVIASGTVGRELSALSLGDAITKELRIISAVAGTQVTALEFVDLGV